MIRVKCTTFDDYFNYISGRREEVKKFVDGFTVNYTFFLGIMMFLKLFKIYLSMV